MRGKLTWLHRRTAGKVHGGPDMRKGSARRDSLIAAIFEAIPSPAFIVDKDVRIVDFNGAAAAVLPAGGKAALGKRGGDGLHWIRAVETAGGGRAPPACRGWALPKALTSPG